MSSKRIGILTSGGDCSGLNSVIRSAYKRCKELNYELIGIKRGVRGLSCDNLDYIVFNDDICNELLLNTSGSIIYSDTKWVSSTIKNTNKTIDDIKNMIIDGYNKLNLEGLIYVGGDGSLKLINELSLGGLGLKNIIAIPKTIDNDVGYTDFSVGFSTSVNIVCDAIDNIRSTAKSHERVMVVEVMGRDAGFIAMYAGVASGVDSIIVPEFNYDIENLKDNLKKCYDGKKNHAIVVVAESVESKEFKHKEVFVDNIVKYSHIKYKGIGKYIEKQLNESGFDSRSITLGHIQRGGKTSVFDRILGSAFGSEAVNLINSNNFGRMLYYSNGSVKNASITDVLNNVNKKLNKDNLCVKIAKDLGVYIGEI